MVALAAAHRLGGIAPPRKRLARTVLLALGAAAAGAALGLVASPGPGRNGSADNLAWTAAAAVQTAQRAEQQGTTGFRLTVGTDGRVSACTITSSSGSSALDEATCRIMRSRARFTPAHDEHGNPIGDSVSSRIRWVLPPS